MDVSFESSSAVHSAPTPNHHDGHGAAGGGAWHSGARHGRHNGGVWGRGGVGWWQAGHGAAVGTVAWWRGGVVAW